MANDIEATLSEMQRTLEAVERNQRKELENIRFNTGWSFFMLTRSGLPGPLHLSLP